MRIKAKYLRWIALSCVVFATGIVQYRIDTVRIKEGLTSTLSLVPGDNITGALLGGFKGFAADLMWIRIDMYWESGQWYKIMPLYHAISFLQPYFLLVWELGGWHMASNMSHAARFPHKDKTLYADEEHADLWIQRGLSFMKKGILYHNDKFNLYFTLGDTYYRQVHDYAMAAKYFKEASRKSPHPRYVDRMLAHAYRKAGMLQESYEVWLKLSRELSDEHSEMHRRVVEKNLILSEKMLGKSP